MYVNRIDATSRKLAQDEHPGNVRALGSARIIERWWFS